MRHLSLVFPAALIAIASGCAAGPSSSGREDAAPPASSAELSQEEGQARLSKEARARATRLFDEGRDYKAAGDYVRAVESFAGARQADPGFGLAHLEEAICSQYIGVDREAVRARFAAALELLEENPRALYEQAAFEESSGEVATAMEGYQRALDLRPSHKDARLALARAQLSSDQLEEALETFRQVLEGDAHNLAALLGAADAAERLGQHAAAERSLRRVVDRYPEVAAHRQRLIAFFERTGQTAKAARESRRLEDLDPRAKRKMRSLKPSRRR